MKSKSKSGLEKMRKKREKDAVKSAKAAVRSAKLAASPKSNKLRLRLVRAVTLLLALALAGFMVVNVMMDNKSFEVTFYKVSSDKLKSNMRTVLISDIHMAKFGSGNKSLLEAIERLEPDFISVTGDTNTVHDKNGLEYTSDLCAQLAAIAPVYYALGNNEIDEIVHRKIDYKTAISQSGATLLHDRTIETSINGNAVVIGGLSYRMRDTAKYAPKFLDGFLSKKGYRILLTHYPESFSEGLEDRDIDLALCGHAHGGQIRLPYIGALYTPDQGLLPDLTEGCISFGDLKLVISRGLGNSSLLPRINNKPELVVVDMCTY